MQNWDFFDPTPLLLRFLYENSKNFVTLCMTPLERDVICPRGIYEVIFKGILGEILRGTFGGPELISGEIQRRIPG